MRQSPRKAEVVGEADAAGSYEQVAGIALGSIIGAAVVALALAFGITALIAPMTFEKVPKPVLGVPIATRGTQS